MSNRYLVTYNQNGKVGRIELNAEEPIHNMSRVVAIEKAIAADKDVPHHHIVLTGWQRFEEVDSGHKVKNNVG